MEDHFDTILYIVIALVAFVISALGKKKKQPAQITQTENYFEDSQQNPTHPFFRNFEELLNDQMDVDSSFSPKEEEKTKEILQEGRSPMIENNSSLTKSLIQTKIDKIKQQTESESNPIFDNDLTKQDDDELVVDDFDVRQAIIGSEILNRKQY